jgi:hypothetical protein
MTNQVTTVKSRTLAMIIIFSVLIGVVVGGLGISYYLTTIPAPAPTTDVGTYLTYLNSTKVYLINSTLSYAENSIVINSTVRNDYDRYYYFAITANLYTSNGEKLEGTKYVTDPPGYGFAVVYVPSQSVENFDIHFNYSKQDVKDFTLLLAFPPMDTPPP